MIDDLRNGVFRILYQDGATAETVDVTTSEIERSEVVIRLLEGANARLRIRIEEEGDDD